MIKKIVNIIKGFLVDVLWHLKKWYKIGKKEVKQEVVIRCVENKKVDKT